VGGVPNDIRQQRETDLYAALFDLFHRHAFAFAEVPFFGKHIDLVFGTSALLWLYAVETKLRDWRGALKQAALNQLAAQHSYVALPDRLAGKVADRDRQVFASYSVGLISVGSQAKIVVPATRNGYFNPPQYRVLKGTLTRAARTQKPQEIGVLANALSERSRAMVLLQARTS
jgi:hypothetical protein